MRRALFVTFAFVWGCQSTTTPPPHEQSSAEAPKASALAVAPSSSATPSASVAPGAVRITNLGPGRFEIAASGKTTEKVATRLVLERHDSDGAWKPLDGLDLGAGYRLLSQCDGSPLPACRELAPGSAIRPAPFKGFSCSSQCNGSCRGNVWEGPAELRLVVKACEGGGTFVGPAFQLPDADHASEGALARFALADGLTRGAVMRLEIAAGELDAPASEGKLVGFPIRKGTERALDASALTALAERLRDAHGYNDEIQKRCAMKTLIGLRLVRALATTGDASGAPPREVTEEVAIDFNCQKLFAVINDDAASSSSAGPTKRLVHATHFDPSRAAFLALAKAALPGDAEVQALKGPTAPLKN